MPHHRPAIGLFPFLDLAFDHASFDRVHDDGDDVYLCYCHNRYYYRSLLSLWGTAMYLLSTVYHLWVPSEKAIQRD